MEEILAEVTLKNKRKQEVEDWVTQLREAINSIPNDKEHPVSLL